MGIQINGNTNNINAGIGSLSIEDINELDIVGVATAANFKTGVSDLHSVGLTLSGGQIDVGSNIKIGTAGVVTATTFSGSGASLTNLNASAIASGTVPTARLGSGSASSSTFLAGDSTFKTVTGTTINNNANNRLITGSGTANTLEGESTLTYDGDGLLNMTSSSGPAELTLVAPSANDSGIYFNDGSNDGAITYDHSTRNMNFRANSQTKFRIEGDTKTLKIQRAPSSDVDITLARAQRWGYSASWQGLIIGNPNVGNMSSLFLNYDPSSNTSGSFAGDGREIVVRKNAKIIVPNAADNGFYNAIEFNAGGDRDDGVSRFRQGILVSNDSADANVLNDYEEGEYTANLRVTSGSATFTTQGGSGNKMYYTKIGNIVYVNGGFSASSVSGAGGHLQVSLPFATASNSSGVAKGAIGSIWNYYGSSNPYGNYGWYPLHAEGMNANVTNNITLYKLGYNGSNSNWGPIGNLIGNNSQVHFSFTYRTN